MDTVAHAGVTDVTPRLAAIQPRALTTEQRALYDAILGGRRATQHKGISLTNADGSLVGPFNAMLRSPSLGSAVQRLGEEVRFGTSLRPGVRELIVLLVAAESRSAFEWAAHEAIARIVGVPGETIEDVRAMRKPSGLAVDEDVAWDATREILADHAISDTTYERGLAEFGERGMFDIAVIVGYFRMIAGVLGTFSVAPPEPRPR